MRIDLLSYLYRPDQAGGANIFSDLAEGLAERGHDVSVTCAYPFYPEWTNKSGANPWRQRTEELDGVTVRRCGMFIPTDPTSMGHRALYEGSFLLSQLRTLFSGSRPDVVVALAPLVSSVANGVLRAKVRRVPLWIHVQDVSSGGAISFENAGRVPRALAKVESYLFNQANILSTISPAMAAGISELTGRSDVRVIPNWLHSELAGKIELARVGSGTEPNRPVQILYSGNLGLKQGLDTLVDALAKTDFDFHLEINGAGSGQPQLDETLDRLGDERFSRGPLLPEEDFVDKLVDCDIFLVSEKDTGEAAFLPSKLVPAVAAGCLVLAVCGDDSPMREEFAQFGTGRCIGWNEIDSIADTVAEMLEDDARGAMVQAAEERARTLSSVLAIDTIEELLADLSGDVVRPDG